MTSKKRRSIDCQKVFNDRFETVTSISRKFCEQAGQAIPRKSVSCRLNRKKRLARIPSYSQRRMKRFVSTSLQNIYGRMTMEYCEFSDESMFNLFGSDGKNFVKRRNAERLSLQCVKKTVNTICSVAKSRRTFSFFFESNFEFEPIYFSCFTCEKHFF